MNIKFTLLLVLLAVCCGGISAIGQVFVYDDTADCSTTQCNFFEDESIWVDQNAPKIYSAGDTIIISSNRTTSILVKYFLPYYCRTFIVNGPNVTVQVEFPIASLTVTGDFNVTGGAQVTFGEQTKANLTYMAVYNSSSVALYGTTFGQKDLLLVDHTSTLYFSNMSQIEYGGPSYIDGVLTITMPQTSATFSGQTNITQGLHSESATLTMESASFSGNSTVHGLTLNAAIIEPQSNILVSSFISMVTMESSTSSYSGLQLASGSSIVVNSIDNQPSSMNSVSSLANSQMSLTNSSSLTITGCNINGDLTTTNVPTLQLGYTTSNNYITRLLFSGATYVQLSNITIESLGQQPTTPQNALLIRTQSGTSTINGLISQSFVNTSIAVDPNAKLILPPSINTDGPIMVSGLLVGMNISTPSLTSLTPTSNIIINLISSVTVINARVEVYSGARLTVIVPTEAPVSSGLLIDGPLSFNDASTTLNLQFDGSRESSDPVINVNSLDANNCVVVVNITSMPNTWPATYTLVRSNVNITSSFNNSAILLSLPGESDTGAHYTSTLDTTQDNNVRVTIDRRVVSGGTLAGWKIALIVIGSVIGAALLAFGAVFIYRRARRSRTGYDTIA
ncbi:hypothetical protein SAMD00019534_088540 [Acytostelium subglobosum LB1]|uniref:hypothetical protein n=1 Tax=Acytostelium subglobosum LB1 TaxID=1410327 RepID=UPI000644E1AC|nr:hypothetical protein SAMD00019534_088540 [Acytostelium subglobosum LB1]GAM25679.1 hypothetical protein SAMD00019534_088540 [Acytostelium subglobosum LB1]|eukprot:XP_012751197.1 hypothetical protein SAMD00019534_088540 [Acytostelium subglobosum LB1]